MEPLPGPREESTYIHLSLYQFTPEARQHVIERVNAELNDTSARCWYNVEGSSFELRCPCTVGAKADEALATAIKEYCRQEMKATELEDREPNILRFPEGDIQPLDGHIDDLEEDMIQRETASNTQDQTPHRSSFQAFHLVETEGAASMSLKLLGMYELPEGHLERTLCSAADRETSKAIRCGMTARAVRSEGRRDDVVFNGRFGSPIAIDHTLDLVSLAPFPTLKGHSTLGVQTERADVLIPETGDGPVMDKWFAGMAQTKPCEPEQKPEIPKDARKLFAPGHQSLSGKTRIPKADPDLLRDTEGSDSDDEDFVSRATSKDFASVMARTKARRSKSEDSETTTETSEEDENAKEPLLFSQTQDQSIKGVPHPKQSFAALLGKEEVSSLSSPPQAAENGYSQAQSDLATRLRGLESSSDIQTKPPGTNGDEELAPYNKLQSYGPQFAAVDNIGLTANAVNQATWDNQHYERGKKAKKSRIRLADVQPSLAAQPTTGSAPMSLSTGPNLPHAQALQVSHASAHISDLVSDTTLGNNPDAALWTKQWSHNVVKPTVSQGILIDDTASYARGPVKIPPGLQPSSTILTADRSQTTTDVGSGSSTTQVGETSPGLTIDVENICPLVRPFFGAQQQASGESDVHRNDDGDEDDGTIVERLRPQQEDMGHFQKKNTMSQKAKKKGKAIKPKAELPLPDPVPMPRPSIRSAKQNSIPTPKIGMPANAEVHSKAETLDDLEKSFTNAERLDSFLQENDILIQNSDLRVRLGLILNLNGTKAMRDRVITPDALADDLNSNCTTGRVVFNGRLTTDSEDVSYLLNLVDSPLSIKVLYEFHARDSSGQVHRVEVEVLQDGSMKAQSLSEVTAEIYVHFPIRVWDAMVSLREAPTDAHFFEAFLASLSTFNEPPSFTAIVPSNQFSIERVFAKRVFARSLGENSTARLVITQVQDLFVSSLNSPNANLQVTCLCPEEMIAHQRVWWEAHFESLSNGAEICDAVNGVITLMDGVGFNSRGPWTAAPQEVDEEVPREPSFW
ncbi:hypothetical protein KC318_g7999 [Hortaea werneckii]|nr:hypothetical protein KC334_g9202 [Hortaea werneckii]KAI7005291.1 hypothetical protein KC355_g8278 [Hortaea werneckii]KAI7199644.1 hypothetical protein KC324_g3149 [Hortaea werneckii]KAI7591973.1 hypothetical protein KC316_g2573 [Hortaea werneckii]KAI7663971.1 hypothetical protein KC318_g7999 [Hortaea werneckii]